MSLRRFKLASHLCRRPLRACLDGSGPLHYAAATSICLVVQRPESTEASSVGFGPFAELSGGHALIPSTGSIQAQWVAAERSEAALGVSCIEGSILGCDPYRGR